jgi:DNA-binding XRE family transcriptional regulator
MEYQYDRDALKESRERLGYTQELAAFEIGVSRVTWNMWEQGHRTPDAVQIALICNLFKIEPAHLVKAG